MSSPLKRGYFFRSLCSIGYSEYQPFLVKVKGTANRVAGAKGHEPYGPEGQVPHFPRGIYLSMRRQLIDYYGTRWGKLPISQEELLVHETTIDRLLWYSMGASSLFPKRNFSSMRRQLIDYYGTRSSDGTRSLFSKNFSSTRLQLIDYYGTQ